MSSIFKKGSFSCTFQLNLSDLSLMASVLVWEVFLSELQFASWTSCFIRFSVAWGDQGGESIAGCCWGTKSCPTLCDPMDWSMPGFPVLHYLPEFAQVHVHWVGDVTNHLILCHSLLLWPSTFPSLGVFSNELALHIRWPKCWSFSFSISPSNEYSVLIFFRIDWFDLAVKGLSRVFSSTIIQKHQFLGTQPSLWSNSQFHTWLLEKP